ncbi:MAG: hypothetical protein RL088_1382 [Verrucomicrobiota bacterium]
MIVRFSRLAGLAGVFAAAVSPLGAQTPGPGWALNWSDEFDGAALDTTKWSITTGARRDAQNVAAAVAVAGGAMTISTYTEGGVHKTGFIGSSGKFDNAYGYWEARVRFTSRDGMWSAFWIQSPTINNTGNNPAANGTEIDVVEHRNKDSAGTVINNRTVTNIHWDGYGADHKSIGSGLVNNPGATGLQGNWHTYGVLWEPGIQRFYIDGVEVWSQTTAVSQINHFIYLTSEVETGGWAYNIPAGGYGTLGSATNAKMEVDYVRFYSRAERVGNGAFTNRVGNWDPAGNSSWSSTGGRSGGGGGRINPQTTSGANFEQTVAGLVPGVPYVLTGWGTVGSAAWPDIRIGVKNHGGAQVYDAISSTGFTEAEVPFTTGMTNTSARIFAWVPTQWGDAYADDMQVRRAAAVMDAGFESGVEDEFWAPYGDTLVHSWQPVRSGGYAFRFNNPAADRGLEQIVRGLTPGATYRLSCWMRTDNQSLQLGVKNHGAAQTSTSKTGTGNTWTKHTHTFTMGAASTSATVFAYIPSTAANSVVDVDDFFLAESLAAEWTATDVGTVGLAGESGIRGGRWVLRGAGSDIWGTADSHRFVQKSLTGDGAVTARLRSFETDRTTSKSGVMMRASLAADAQVVHLGWRGDDRMETIRRTATAASATGDLGAVGSRVEWVRIHRRGNVFTTLQSADGVTWTPLGAAQTIAMPATIFAGLSACAATTTDWTETSVENLSVAADAAPTIAAPANQSISENSATSALAYTVGDDFTAAASLTVTKASSNTTLVPAANIVLGGSGANRTVTVTPALNQSGTTTITLTVSDGVLTTSDTFVLTVVDLTTPVTVTVPIATSADDAEESAAGAVSLTSTDIELVDDGGLQTVGLRFAGLNIPQGAVISSATIQFKTDEVQSEATTLDIAAQAADTAPVFTTTASSLSSRAITNTTVLWQPAAWNTIGEATATQRTPNLAALVQEIVSRPGWASGNAIAFLIEGTGHRTAEAFDKAGGVPATLSVTYSVQSNATFAQWMTSFPALTGNNALSTANPDGDAFNNLLEYALATSPAQSNAASYSIAQQGNTLIFTYTRPSVAPDLTYAVEWSQTLAAASWSTAGVTQQILSDNGTIRTVKAIVPAGTAALFLRLKVTSP